MNLLIVESPNVARQIAQLLGEGWRVEATRGHLKDLDLKALSVDVRHDFALHYQVVPDHFGTLARLKAAAQQADNIYLGTAPDREGETIAAHLTELLANDLKGKPIHRVTFSTVTGAALQDGICQPRDIDTRLVEAQLARRTIDRLVGYLISALATRMLNAPHSIGRVQMAVLWLLAEREVEIHKGRRLPSTRYDDTSLHDVMETRGIGRSGTYEHVLRLLLEKGYLVRKGDRLLLTAHAKALCTLLSHHFPELFSADYTAHLEHQLDQIAAGERSRLEVVREFWRTFSRTYQPLAAVFLPDDTPAETPAMGTCPKCGGQLVTRRTRSGGQFAACEHFPRCHGRPAPALLNAVKVGQ